MFTDTLTRFRGLRTPVRSLVFLYWIYTFTGALAGGFIQIFLFELFSDIRLNIIASMVSFTGIMVGFCVFGVLVARFRLNAKQGFLLSFIVLAMSFALLLVSSTPYLAYVAMFANGVGNGLFWLTIHTFELSETTDKERDFYSSLLSASDQVSSLLGPATAAFLLWLSGSVLMWGDFALLFLLTPIFFLFGFLCFAGIPDYHPMPIEWADVRHFLGEHKNRTAQIYLFGGGSQHILSSSVLPLVSLALLGTALNVGIFNTVFAILSVALLLFLSGYRHAGNRLPILGVTIAILAFLYVYVGYSFTLVSFVVLTLAGSILGPLKRVSEHVIDLQTMESIGRTGKDFYPTMILRDFSLWAWRMLAGGIFLIAAYWIGSERTSLSAGMYLLAGADVVTFIGAVVLLSKRWIKKSAPGPEKLIADLH